MSHTGFNNRLSNMDFDERKEMTVDWGDDVETPGMRCGVCKKDFTSAEELNVHVQQSHSWRCSICKEFTCSSENELKVHAYQSHVRCTVCKQDFVNQAAHDKHFMSVHRDIILKNTSGKTSQAEAQRQQ